MVPIGRGQRELIIGDRQTGKTALAIDTIINQKSSGIKCIYVAIGQKQSTIANVVRKLEEHGALAPPCGRTPRPRRPRPCSTSPAYSGVTNGRVLPWTRARTHSLFMMTSPSRRSPTGRSRSCCAVRRGARRSRETCFYLHSRLLERSARVNEEYVTMVSKGAVKGKTGSLTGCRSSRPRRGM